MREAVAYIDHGDVVFFFACVAYVTLVVDVIIVEFGLEFVADVERLAVYNVGRSEGAVRASRQRKAQVDAGPSDEDPRRDS